MSLDRRVHYRPERRDKGFELPRNNNTCSAPDSALWQRDTHNRQSPTNASWLNRIEAQFQELRYFTLDGTDHRSHEEQNSMIRRYIARRNRNAHDKTLRELVKRAKRCLMGH